MAENLPPVPYKIKFTNDAGFLSDPWAKWFRQLFTRIGGSVALTNADLEADIAALEATTATHTSNISSLQTSINDILQGRTL